ncbi:MAG TPA: hypothetical protein VFV19_19700 [Candidatus Polarisedimenticolaceae bacterium]|nr:hypothetical protein [Candidatus Polarisedimenticolaceae bacterium]
MSSIPIVGICLLLMGQAGGSSYRFEGRLVDRGATVIPDAILVGWGEGGCGLEAQSQEHIGVYPDGTIPLTVGAHFIHTITLDGKETGAPAIIEWPCYRFQARGCKDAVVKFGPDAPSGTIVLQCPGREAPRGVDG